MALFLFLQLLMSSWERSQRVLGQFTELFGLTTDCKESQSLAGSFRRPSADGTRPQGNDQNNNIIIRLCGSAHKEDVYRFGKDSRYWDKSCCSWIRVWMCLFTSISFLFLTGRKVTETTPTFLSPSGSDSSKMVLRGEELLLECIAAGLWAHTHATQSFRI